MIDKMIVDADLCIKLGGSSRYRFLYDILPCIARQIYMHSYAQSEVMMPQSAVEQLNALISEDKVVIVDEKQLEPADRIIYSSTYKILADLMIDPARPTRNKGEVSSLAYAKTAGIPVFATDEMNLQPIIDKKLNTGIDDIHCLRISDIIDMAHSGELNLPRKVCKALWVIAGKNKEFFDRDIWPL